MYKLLFNDSMLKADFHIHTGYSPCSNMKPEDIIKTAVSKGYDVIGVVDHDSIKGGIKTKRIAGKKILVIPGEEIKTRYGEIIIFLSDGRYNKNLIDICERAKDLNHFVVVPHPFDFLRFIICLKGKIREIENFVDAIEVFNSRTLFNHFNDLANRYATRNKIPKIAGSDAHYLEEIGNATAYLDCKRNVDSVFKCIRKNKVRFNGKRCSIRVHLKSNVSYFKNLKGSIVEIIG